MLEEKQRIGTFDLVRGFAMLCIVAGHLFDGFIYLFVFTFHVPVFFLIGGYFYCSDRAKLKGRIQRLLKPYLFTVLAVAVLDVVRALIRGLYVGSMPGFQKIGELIFHWILAGLYGSGSRRDFFSFNLPVIGSIWFLLAYVWVLIFMELMQAQTGKLDDCKKSRVEIAEVLALFLVGFWSARITWLPLSLQAGCVSLLFFYLGHLEKQDLHRLVRNKVVIAVSCVVWGIAVVFSVRHDFMSLVRCAFPDLPINILGACAAELVLLSVAETLENHDLLPRARAWMEWIGRNTLPFLCFHLIEMKIFPWTLFDRLGWNPALEQILIYCLKLIWCVLGVVAVHRIKPLKRVFE